MPMIQGIDANSLIAAFRAGKSDRAADDAQRAAQESQRQIGGLMGQLFGGQQQPSQGIAGQYATSAPQKSQFESAFSPEAMGRLGRGADMGPVEAPATAAAPVRQPEQRRPDPNILARLVALDPETGGKLVTVLKSMDEMNLKALETKNTALGAAAQWISQYPEAQRAQMLAVVMPHLTAAGWTEQEVTGKPLSDAALRAYQGQAMDMDTIIDNEMAERKFQSGEKVAVAPGGNVAIVRPDGSAQWVIGGGQQGGQPANIGAGNIPQEAIDALRKGEGTKEQFDAIFGTGAADRILGGGGGNATGGFPPGP